MAIHFAILRNGDDFSRKADEGSSFFRGAPLPYEGNIGLYKIFARSKLEKLNFAASDFQPEYGFWATFVGPRDLRAELSLILFEMTMD